MLETVLSVSTLLSLLPRKFMVFRLFWGKNFTDFAETKTKAVTWPTSARRHDLMIYSKLIRKLKRKTDSRQGKN